MVRKLRFNLNPGIHSVYNLGNGGGFSNKDILDTVQRVTGKRLSVNMHPRREGDPAVLVASSVLAETELGWKPRITSIEGIIDSAWKFYLSQQLG